ncbi:hypothetical protein K1719_046398 [Acacia pycnantha]|nr:hypothetical protein K1719_046398 [Acacia pycnantha]
MKPNQQVIVREVWVSNFHSELSLIYSIIPYFSFASFDTEFPGTIITPYVDKHSYSMMSPAANYSFMKANVDILHIIQLGLTLSDSNGNLPHLGTQNGHIWQFNFSDFHIERDYHNAKSIQLLEKQGMNFLKNKKEGIPSWLFRDFILRSGLLFNSHLKWVTFHSSYDFGFLIKLITGRQLPSNIDEFRELVARFFGSKIYDMKHIIKFCNGLNGGLERVAKLLNVDRVVGNRHQAGSDSLLILQTFMKLKDVYFSEHPGLEKFQEILYGFEVNSMIPNILKPQYQYHVVHFGLHPVPVLLPY